MRVDFHENGAFCLHPQSPDSAVCAPEGLLSFQPDAYFGYRAEVVEREAAGRNGAEGRVFRDVMAFDRN